MDQIKHKRLSVDQLTTDSRFIAAIMAGEDADTGYLQRLKASHSNQRHIIKAAQQLVLQLSAHYQSQSPSEELKQRILNRIRNK